MQKIQSKILGRAISALARAKSAILYLALPLRTSLLIAAQLKQPHQIKEMRHRM